MRAACWLMQHFDVDDGLIGDLLERHRARRSLPRLWFETVNAISSAITLSVKRDPRLVIRAILVGLLLRVVHKALWYVVWPSSDVHLMQFSFLAHGMALYWADMVMAIPGWMAIGWLVARFHRTTLVLPYVIAAWMLATPTLVRQAGNAWDAPRFRPYLLVRSIGEAVFGISVMTGALWSRKAQDAGPIP